MSTLSLAGQHGALTKSDHFVFGTILVSCLTVALAAYYYRNHAGQPKEKSTKSSLDGNDDEAVVKLLSIEQLLAMGGGGDNAMSTFTWFKMSATTTSDNDNIFDNTKQLLKDRFYEIIKANPWTVGRILKRDGEHSLVYPKKLWADANDDAMSEYFFCLEDEVSRDTPYDQLGSKMSHLMLKTGPKEPLCRVTIIPSSSDTEQQQQHFAVLFTMSHVIGDGATFFKLNNMLLNFEEAIVSLESKRIMTTEEQQIQVMGGEPEYKILQSHGFVANMVKGVFANVFKNQKASSRFYLVNREGMNNEKKKYQSSSEDDTKKKQFFVSTNDVLSSWFFQNSTCQHGLMAINWRGRLPGHTDMHAGNYENVLFYRREDSKSPDLIRKSLTADLQNKNKNDEKQLYQRQVTQDQPMPGFWDMANGSVALATNWSSFSKPSSIPGGWQEDMQIPLYDTSKILPSTMAIMLIFRAGPNGMGVFVAGSPDKLAKLLDHEVPFLLKEPL